MILPGLKPWVRPRRIVSTFAMSQRRRYAAVKPAIAPGVIASTFWYSLARFQESATSRRSTPENDGESSSISVLYSSSSMYRVISGRLMFSMRR